MDGVETSRSPILVFFQTHEGNHFWDQSTLLFGWIRVAGSGQGVVRGVDVSFPGQSLWIARPCAILFAKAIVETLVDVQVLFPQVFPQILTHHKKDSAAESGPGPQQTSHEWGINWSV